MLKFVSINTKNLTLKERVTFKLHFLYSLLEGLVMGVVLLNDFIFKRSLHGDNYQMAVLIQFSMLVLVFSIFANEIVKRTQNLKRLIRIIALCSRLPLLLILFFPRNDYDLQQSSIYQYVFLIIFFLYYIATPIIFPLINLLLKTNYQHKNFGKLYSYSTSINKFTVLITAFIVGFLLDINTSNYTYIYPTMGLIGIFSLFSLSRIAYRPASIKIKQTIINAGIQSIKNMITVLKYNKPYRDFQIGFMFYGFAFMSTLSVVTIFLEEQLVLNYSSVAFYKNFANVITIVTLPYMGNILSKFDPRRFAVITFTCMLGYLLFILITNFFRLEYTLITIEFFPVLILAFIFFGLFTGSMNLLWNIGSAYFCKKEEAGLYQSIHLTLTGFRGFFAPLLGVVFYTYYGFTIAFCIAMACLVFAIGLMFYSIKKSPMNTTEYTE